MPYLLNQTLWNVLYQIWKITFPMHASLLLQSQLSHVTRNKVARNNIKYLGKVQRRDGSMVWNGSCIHDRDSAFNIIVTLLASYIDHRALHGLQFSATLHWYVGLLKYLNWNGRTQILINDKQLHNRALHQYGYTKSHENTLTRLLIQIALRPSMI